MRVFELSASPAVLLEESDRQGVFAPQVVEVGDVVVGLESLEQHVVLAAVAGRLTVGLESGGELVRVLEADRDVAQHRADVLGSPHLQQVAIGGAILLQGLGEATQLAEPMGPQDHRVGPAGGV